MLPSRAMRIELVTPEGQLSPDLVPVLEEVAPTGISVVPAGEADVDAGRFTSPGFAYWAFDRLADGRAGRDEPLRIGVAPGEGRYLRSMLARLQRLRPRTNAASDAPWFVALRARHRALYERPEPLVRADYDHAVDVWQWCLRLQPAASGAAQAAALLHDVERLESEAQRRIEHLAPSYVDFKRAHARRGAVLAAALVAEAGAPADVAAAVAHLVAGHEEAGASPDAALVNEADALSFFALNSPGYLDYFGAPQGRAKVAYTLARLSPAGRRVLVGLELRADVATLVAQELRVEARDG